MTLNDWTVAIIDNGNGIIAAYIDFAKAFEPPKIALQTTES